MIHLAADDTLGFDDVLLRVAEATEVSPSSLLWPSGRRLDLQPRPRSARRHRRAARLQRHFDGDRLPAFADAWRLDPDVEHARGGDQLRVGLHRHACDVGGGHFLSRPQRRSRGAPASGRPCRARGASWWVWPWPRAGRRARVRSPGRARRRAALSRRLDGVRRRTRRPASAQGAACLRGRDGASVCAFGRFRPGNLSGDWSSAVRSAKRSAFAEKALYAAGVALPVAALRGLQATGGSSHLALVGGLVARIDGAGFEQADVVSAMIGVALRGLCEVREHGYRAHVVEVGCDRIVRW